MKFVDEVLITVKGGDGGDGAIAFRREKYVPRGGPAGGDGGKGGDVVMQVDEGLSTLLDFQFRHDHRAEDGNPGATKDKYGRAGRDLVLRIPPGTEVLDPDGGQVADLREHGQRFIAAQGGRGGRGNIHFATSTDRAPRKREEGIPGEERSYQLSLKLLADVGIVGFPNAGKSTFISRISAARPKIADYPFTTLVPNLGMVRLSDDRSFVVADVPGLIEGAHRGAGLGHRFLRHLERTRVLLLLLDRSADPERNPANDFLTLRRELELFDPIMLTRPMVVALNKSDLPETAEALDELQATMQTIGGVDKPLVLSAATGAGVQAVLEALWKKQKAPNADPAKH